MYYNTLNITNMKQPNTTATSRTKKFPTKPSKRYLKYRDLLTQLEKGLITPNEMYIKLEKLFTK